MTTNKLFSVLAITSVIAFAFMAFELRSLSLQVEQITALLVDVQEPSIEMTDATPTTRKINDDAKNNFTVSNASIDLLAKQVAQRVLDQIKNDRPSVARTTAPIIIDTPEVKIAATQYAAEIITPFVGVTTNSQDWNEMGKQLARITDPSEKFQTIGAILGAINNGDLRPPENDDMEYLHTLLNPQ